ncbi:MAG: hypothetical protein ACI9OJ_001204 [Myxococcota bacterium]|jgi:hypothetical protein
MRCLIFVVATLGCAPVTEAPTPEGPGQMAEQPAALESRCDAGDEAFVRRLLPVLWGARAESTSEIRVMAKLVEQLGRGGFVRAMARSPKYREHWRMLLSDWLHVSRSNERANPACYGSPSLDEESTELAEFIRDHAPAGAGFPSDWNMYDLMRSSLLLDDLSPVFRANLFVHLTLDFSTANLEAARGFRDTRVQDFMATYVGRKSECLVCHSSRQSVTDHADPLFDRTWPVAGWPEEAVFGSPVGRPDADLRPFFRRRGVVAGFYYDEDSVSKAEKAAEVEDAFAPWGLSPVCGGFRRPDEVLMDDSLDTAFLVTEADASASIWDLEALVAAGFERLSNGGTLPEDDASDQSLVGEDALIWLLAQRLSERVWEEMYGWPLTVSHGFPRVRAQRDRLTELSNAFVGDGYSLISLIVVAALDPGFNQLPPAQCGAETDALFDPVFNPWGETDGRVGDIRNTVGDAVTRLGPRALLRTVSAAMGWPMPVEYFGETAEKAMLLQRQMGVFIKPSSAGFRGTSFQLNLAWEQVLGNCDSPVLADECPYIPLLEAAHASADAPETCPLCGEAADELCAWDDRCCGVDWASICPMSCTAEITDDDEELRTYRQKPQAPAAPPEGDFIQRILAVTNASTTYRQVTIALKDRLLAEPSIADDEAAVIEDLLGRKLSDTLDSEADARLRAVCGVLLASPDFVLAGVQSSQVATTPTYVVPGTDFESRCEALQPLFEAGQLTCSPDAATFTN